MSYLAQVTYTGNGSTTQYSITFPYIDSTHIKAFINGTQTTAFTVSSSTLTFTSAPANSAVIRIERQTPTNARIVDFTDGSVLTEGDLDKSADQNFFIAQEITDNSLSKLGLDTDDKFDANNKVIKNLANPVNNQDAVTKYYLENTWLSPTNKTALTTVNANIANINAVNSNATNINSAVSNATNINTVATNIGSVNTVATDISKVIAVANDLAEAVSEVETVADDLNETTSEIDTVATNITNVNNVGNSISNVNALAPKVTELGLLGTSAVVTDLGILGTSANVTAMGHLGTSANVTAMGILGTSSVVTDMGLLGTSANVTAMGVLGTSANVTAMGLLGTSAVVTDLGILGTSAVVTDLDILATTANVTAMGVLGTSANVTAMGHLGTSSNVTAMATLGTSTNVSNMSTLAGITNLNNLANAHASVTSVANNLASVNSFANTYLGASGSAPTQDPDGSALDLGDLYFDTGSNQLKVYSSTGWVNAGSSVNGTSDRFKYTVSGTPTTISGNDDNSNSLSYDAGFIDVFLNGIKMVNGTDVTVTSGNSVVFASALTNGDVVDIITFGTFNIATLGNTSVTGGLSFPDNVKAKFGTGNDLEIYHDGSASIISDVGTGRLILRSDGDGVDINKGTSENIAKFRSDAGVELYYDNTKKIETTASGVAVGGDVQVDNGASLGFGGSNYKIEGSSSANHRIAFHTDGSERARFDANGTLLVGKTSSNIGTAGIELTHDNVILGTRSGGVAQYLNRLSSDGSVLELMKDGTSVGSIGAFGGNTVIGTDDTGLRFNPGGSSDYITPFNVSSYANRSNAISLGHPAITFKDIYLGGGAFIGGTGTANKLDDYEEGTWTPVFAGGSTNGTYTYVEQQGHYVKVGDLVTAWFNLTNITTSSAGSGTIQILGLPFSANWQNGFNGGGVSGSMELNEFNNISGVHTFATLGDGSSQFSISKQSGTNNASSGVSATDRNSNNSDLRGFITYYTGG
jgi:hypothetical protein